MENYENTDLEGGPQTLEEIGRVLITGMVKNFKKMIPVMLAVFIGVWLIHTYVLVWLNEGFNPGGTIYVYILALSGSELTGTLFWMILAFILTATIVKIKKKGPGGFIGDFKDISGMFSSSKDSVSEEFQALMAAGIGICLFVGWCLGNFLVSFMLAIVLLFSLSAKNESLLVLCTRIGYSDIKRNSSGEKEFCPLDMQRTVLLFTGGVAGFVISGILPYIITLILAVLAIGYSAYWYYNKNNQGKNPPGTVVAAGILFVILLSLFTVIPVAADDGGFEEAGGTFESWVVSEGAAIAVIMGLPPALGSVIGILTGIIGVEGASAIVSSGGYSTGMAGGTGSGGTPKTPPESTIYGTGTPDDPFRDKGTVGKTKDDGSIEPYPENKDEPREIWGKGTKDDPYRDYPGDEASVPEEPVIEKTPQAPPKEPVQPEPEPPAEEPPVAPPAEPPKPQKPPEVQPPEQPLPPEPEPPKPPEPPVAPPVEPPKPPEPPEVQPPEDIIILKEKLERLEREMQELRETKQKRNEIEKKKIEAYRQYVKHGFRGMFKGGKEIFEAVSDPKDKIWEGVKKKMDVETPLDKAKEKAFGKEVEMKDIAEDMKKTKAKYDEIKQELDKMPSAEDLYKQGHDKMEEIRRLKRQIKNGGF